MIIMFTASFHTFPVVFHVFLYSFILLEWLSNHSNCYVPTTHSSRIHWSVKSTGGTRLFIRGLLVEAPGGVQICVFSVLLPGACASLVQNLVLPLLRKADPRGKNDCSLIAQTKWSSMLCFICIIYIYFIQIL